MELQVSIPASAMDFDFNTSHSSPYLTSPSTPKRFGDYLFTLSAPSSPTRISRFYRDLEHFSENSSAIPFDWEDKPGTPESSVIDNGEDDFAFDFSAELEKTSLSADELFDGGKIRQLKPPPPFQVSENVESSGKKSYSFSPRRKRDPDLITAATDDVNTKSRSERGRSKTPSQSSSNSGHRETRSLSPLRISEHLWEEEEEKTQRKTEQSVSDLKPSLSSSSSKGSSKRWRLKDFLLFRSASEGRASDKDPIRKLIKKHEDVRNSSFRSTDSSNSAATAASATAASKKGVKISPHELHYTMNRAVSEDLRKKTFLPYKQGILGRLAFNPAVSALANGFGTLTNRR